MTQQVELFYDFCSPYSYLAFTQLQQMDVLIALKPMQILKVMERVGKVPTRERNSIDLKVQSGAFKIVHPYEMPLVLRHDFAGTIAAVGHQHTQSEHGV